MGRPDDHLVEPLFAALREREERVARPTAEGEEPVLEEPVFEQTVLEQTVERGRGGLLVRLRAWFSRGGADRPPPPPRRG